MKELKNLLGVKTISKKAQENVKGGICPQVEVNCPPGYFAEVDFNGPGHLFVCVPG